MTGHAEEEWLVRSGEVLSEAGFEAEEVGSAAVVVDEFDGPAGVLGGAVAVLSDGVFVVVGEEVLVVVAAEAHRLGVAEEIHADLKGKPKIMGN